MKKLEITPEELSNLLLVDKLSISSISKKLGISRNTVSRRLVELNIQKPYSKKYESSIVDLTLRRFQKLLVISTSDSIDNRRMWICECDCGERRTCSTSELVNSKVTNCGKCWRTGIYDISGKYFSSLKKGAEKRGLEFSITIEDVWNIYISQGMKCSLTNEPIIFCKNNADLKNRLQTASVDRINSSIGYIKSNIRIIHKDINMLKRDMSDDKFILICEKVSKCHREKL